MDTRQENFFNTTSFWLPEFLSGSAWISHAPFAFWLMSQHEPAVLVELGTHTGYSYFSFCQAVKNLHLKTRCFAVDTWKGDEHAGFYGEEIYRSVSLHNESNYGYFSRLIRSTFNEALSHIDDGSVDLLHIDGRHFYKDVKEDFMSWIPKLSDKAVVVFHDTNVRERGFGVHVLWEELKRRHRFFEFMHGNGLGILEVGRCQPSSGLDALFSLEDPSTIQLIQNGYSRLGSSIEDRRRVKQSKYLEERVENLHAVIEAYQTTKHAEGELHASFLAAVNDGALGALRGEIGNSLSRLEKISRKLVRVRELEQQNQALSLWGTTRTFLVQVKRRLIGQKVEPTPVGLSSEKKSIAVQPNITVGQPVPGSRSREERTAETYKYSPIPAVSRNRFEGLIVAILEVSRRDGWMGALPYWEMLEKYRRDIQNNVRVNRVLTPRPASNVVFDELQPATEFPLKKWCIYTTLFGDYDILLPPIKEDIGIDLYCFTDSELKVEGWKTIVVEGGDNHNRVAKRYKVFPYDYLKSYDASLFVDANTIIHGDIRRFIERWCLHESFAMWRHAHRCDVYDEGEAILVLGKHAAGPILRQLSDYEEQGLPRDSGLFEAGFMWRDHNDPQVRYLMDLWWEHINKYSLRDQLSLGYLSWKTSVRPKVFPLHLGNIRTNVATSITRHVSSLSTGLRSRTKQRQAPSVVVPNMRRKIVFIYSKNFEYSGSTIMRGAQLSSLLRSRISDEWDVSYTSDTNVTDAIVVLTKGFLHEASEYEMEKLWSSNIGIIADFVDNEVKESLLEFIDVLWASSISSYRHALLRETYTPVDMVTHHVDLRIDPVTTDHTALSVAYFGELVNAVRDPALDDLVEFFLVNTKIPDDSWLSRVRDYSLHYAVRPSSKKTGKHKPFLKGFTAAHCSANIVVSADDGDARFYLGDDYPFLINSSDPSDAVEAVRFARDAFGGPEWRYGLEIMRDVRARCAPEQIISEVKRSLERFQF